MRKIGLWLLMFTLVISAVLTPGLSGKRAYAAEGFVYDAESASGDMENGSGLTWSNVQAAVPGNYMIHIHYSNAESEPRPFSLSVNGQKYAVFTGSPTGQEGSPDGDTLTAIVLLNQGPNIIKLSAESDSGPQIHSIEVIPFATIFEAENGGGAAHSGVTIAANSGTAPGFSGTGYVSIASGVNGYMLYNNVDVPQTGTYTMKVRYSLGNTARPYAVTVNGERIQDAKGVSTGSWANWQFEELKGIRLNAGANTLKIERIGTNATPVIDRFELVNEEIPDLGDQTFRNTNFETSDVDPVIAGTETGATLNSALISGSALKSSSASTVKMIDNEGSRAAEVTTPSFKPGVIGFPFHASWLAPVPMKSYTLESRFLLKDEQANYIFKLISASGMESPIFAFGMDNHIYARSNATETGAMAARGSWSKDTWYNIKLTVHLDTKSYDMFLNDTRMVNSEPLQNDTYLGGLKGFMMEVKDGARQETKMLVDDVQLSGSNQAGTAPNTNPDPGVIFDEQPYIGEPVQYFVSPGGSDTNNGLSTATAFKTITKAISVTNPGDTVNLMPGTYSPVNDANNFVSINRSGARDVKTGEAHYITYKAYDMNNKPKLLLPPGIKGVWDMVDVSANYIILDGLEIEGNNRNLTLAEGEANYESVTTGGSDWSTYAKTNTNGINLNGHHLIVRNSHVHHMAGGGVGGGGDYITIEHNDIHSNSWYSFYATSGISFMNDKDYDNNTTDYKIIIRNNVVHDNETKVKWEKTKGYSDGNGIIFDVDEAYKGKKLVINNIVYNNGGGGIHIYRSNNVHVINNTVYHNSRSPHLKYPNMDVQSGDNAIFLNNISIARDEEGEYANGSAGWNNLFANNIYGGLTRFLGKNDKVADPKFVSVTEENYDFHLQQDSPAIDTGTRTMAPNEDLEGKPRPYAGAGTHTRVDIGAYETEWNNASFLEDDAVQITEPTPEVPKAGTAAKGTPVIDGAIDEIWFTTQSNQALYLSDPTKGYPLATVRLMWDEDRLYVLAEVKDDNLNAKGGNLWEHDSMEFFVDENNAKTLTYEADDSHYRVNYQNLRSAGKNATADSFTSAAKVVEGGYIIEAALPLRTITPSVGTVIGFDFGASDDSNFDGIRDNATMWSNRRLNSNASTSLFGNVTLVAPPSVEPGTGSGNGESDGGTNSQVQVPDSSEIELTPTLTGNKAAAELTEAMLQAMLTKVTADSEGQKKVTVHIKEAAGAQTYVQSIPSAFFKENPDANQLELRTALATILLSNEMLQGIDLEGASKVEISIGSADRSKLPSEVINKIGDKPVIDLVLFVDGKQAAWKNNQAPVIVSIPYKPTPDELQKPEHIAIWYIDGDGKVVKIPSGRYDARTGMVTFTINHFSTFAIGYQISSFSDLGQFGWAKEAIEVLVSKGIIKGTSDTTFGAGKRITRADFISLLIRTLGIEKEISSNFADVEATDYFYEEVGIAKELGITNGRGDNSFGPEQEIRRQEMMVLTARTLQAAGYSWPVAAEEKSLDSFADVNLVSEYAKSSMAALVQAGMVQGDRGHLNPKGYSSRAEAAVLIYRVYQLLK